MRWFFLFFYRMNNDASLVSLSVELCCLIHASAFWTNLSRGGTGSEFGRVPDPDIRPLLPGRIRVVAGSEYLTCDV